MANQVDDYETPVLFRCSRRKEPEGLAASVTAVFPAEPADLEGRTMTCYARVGQHGACSGDWLATTRPATPAEYADLMCELESIGYRLKVYARRTRQHREAFNAQIRVWRERG